MDREITENVIEIAVNAGYRIMEIYKTDFNVQFKEDSSPLTKADQSAHNYIVDKLNRLTPDIPVFSEESNIVDWDIRKHWEQYWLVDPLDGTKEFIRKNDEFTVNIALIKNNEPFLGVVCIPAQKLVYYADKDSGVYRQKYRSEEERLFPEKTPVDLEKLRILGSRSHRSTTIEAFASNFADPSIISAGSSLKFCLLAEGKADVYPRYGPTSEWDTAAGQCILECAGGVVLDKNGAPLRYNTKDSVINPSFVGLRLYDEKLVRYFVETGKML